MEFNISPLNRSLEQKLQHKIDQKTKPSGSLGVLEKLALQIGLIQNTVTPRIENPSILIFAGDHGIAKEGKVNPFPQAVTAQMVYNFLEGGAAINVFCKQNNLALRVVDAGVNHSFSNTTGLIDAKIAFGTKNYLTQMAMTLAQCKQAIQKGADIMTQLHAEGCNTIGFGEMGIGNTSAAALLMSYYTKMDIKECVGAGTGLSKKGILQKTQQLQKAIEKHRPNEPMEALATFGGFEIAMMTGALLKAAALHCTIIVDGFIVSAALLAAHATEKNILDYCIFAHSSGEQGHSKLLGFLKRKPLLNLQLRSGEGTGAALAFPLVQCATGFLNDMASFEQAKVSSI
ncbi:nicotinate-nucleotide--dimethylbenzimidazole phosphoribosyltransferase [Maribacter sp. 2-571]|uniref:nicotinate-nucleotide--dimethylbenzimidazole phosphoribosyltransferase n=1 Tax=Maribacter sp. 2-571 TaxID=3417569 RepID=UPI003D342DE3